MLVCMFLVQLPCRAQPSPAAAAENGQREYERSVSDGMAASGRKDFAAARAHFARAHALRPSARTLRVLGLTDFALDDFSAAREELEAALIDRIEPISAAQRTELETLLEWMRSHLGKVQLELQPTAARATIDERPVDRTELLLEPGEHRLRVSAPGHLTVERSFHVKPLRPPVVLHERLIAVASPVPRPPLSAAAPEPSRMWLWLGGAGVLCLAGGGTLLGLGVHEANNVSHAMELVTPDDIESRARRADWFTGLGVGLSALGVAGITAGLVSALREDRVEPRARAWFYGVGPLSLSVGQHF